MAKVANMQQLQDILQDPALRQRIEGAPDEEAVTVLIQEAGEVKGFRFDDRWLQDVYVDVKVARKPVTFTEEELLELASTVNNMWSQPKLCHTESCGGHPDACC